MAGQLHDVQAVFNQAAQVYGEGVDLLADQFADDVDALTSRFPPVLRQTVFITIYSLFEQGMNDLCVRVRDVAQQRGIAQGPRVNIPGVVLPAQQCLRRFNVRLTERSPAWRRFQGYVGVRNAIAHNHGRLRANRADNVTRQFIRHQRHIRVQGAQITVERAFCDRVIDDMRTVLSSTARAIPQNLFTV